MKEKKIVIIFLLTILILLIPLFLSSSIYNYTFSIFVVSNNSNIMVPSYLMEDYLISKLKWPKKLVLTESQIEKIKQINRDSIEPLKNMINTDFLILIELFSDTNFCRIHIYSFLHNLYCGNIMVFLNEPQITISILNLYYNLFSKLSYNYNKDDFKKVIDLISKKYFDENKKEILIVSDKAAEESLIILLFIRFYSQIISSKNLLDQSSLEEGKGNDLILFNLTEKITKIILNKKYYDKINIADNIFFLIKESNFKTAITELLKSKLNSTQYYLLSMILLY